MTTEPETAAAEVEPEAETALDKLNLDFSHIDHVMRETSGLMRKYSSQRRAPALKAAALLLATAEAILLTEPMQRFDQDLIRRDAREFARRYRKNPGLH